jgi:hypothetical protein
MKTAYSILILSAATATLVMIGAQSGPEPKAVASAERPPSATIIDHSAELAAKDARIAELEESLRVAADKAATLAPAVETPPAAGVPTSHAAFVAYGPTRSQCASGQCQQPAAAPKQYQYQSRSSQPRRLFSGRLFGRR